MVTPPRIFYRGLSTTTTKWCRISSERRRSAMLEIYEKGCVSNDRHRGFHLTIRVFGALPATSHLIYGRPSGDFCQRGHRQERTRPPHHHGGRRLCEPPPTTVSRWPSFVTQKKRNRAERRRRDRERERQRREGRETVEGRRSTSGDAKLALMMWTG